MVHSSNELYKIEGIKTRYSTWIRREIEKYRFIENNDYIRTKTTPNGGRPLVDYLFTATAINVIKTGIAVSKTIWSANRNEICFFMRLHKILNTIKTLHHLTEQVIYQHPICNNKYRVDGYYPVVNLAIEYDESHHQYRRNEDKIRENEIRNQLGCEIIRVDYRNEDESIGEIVDYFITRS